MLRSFNKSAYLKIIYVNVASHMVPGFEGTERIASKIRIYPGYSCLQLVIKVESPVCAIPVNNQTMPHVRIKI